MFNENLLFFKMFTIIFYYSPQPLCYIAINGTQHILGYFFPNFPGQSDKFPNSLYRLIVSEIVDLAIKSLQKISVFFRPFS